MVNSVTFAIGDVHGCFDKLEALIAACDLLSEGENASFVFVGDYVDRGPDARKVIEFLIENQLREPDRFICLRGNHEAMLIAAADEDRSDRDLMDWWANGGEQTLDSYGVNDPGALPADHLAWMKALPLTFSDSKRFYVHAESGPAFPSRTSPRRTCSGYASRSCRATMTTARLWFTDTPRQSRGCPTCGQIG
jgi:serine/threonine protein phosphatase 1